MSIKEFSREEFHSFNEADWPLNAIPTSRWTPKKEFKPEVTNIIQRMLSFLILPVLKRESCPFPFVTEYRWGERVFRYGARYILIPLQNGAFMKLTLLCNRQTNSLKEGRIYLYAPGNAECANSEFKLNSFAYLADCLKSKAVLLDYRLYNVQGDKISQGLTKAEVLKIHRLALHFIEEELQGQEIVLIGRSMGSAIQAESLSGYPLKPSVRCLTVNVDAFCDLAETVACALSRTAGSLVRYSGWNLATADCLNRLPLDHIVVQSIAGDEVTIEKNVFTRQVFNDGIITPNSALAPKLSAQTGCAVYFFGIPQRIHNDWVLLQEWGVVNQILDLFE